MVYKIILDIIVNYILPTIAIIISVYTLKKQDNLEKKTSAPCIIIHKDEIVLENNWRFEKDEKFEGKSVNIRSSVLNNRGNSELFTTLVLNYSDKSIKLSSVTEIDYKKFLNHSIITIKNIGNPVIKIEILSIEIMFSYNPDKNFRLKPKTAVYCGYLDYKEELDIFVTFLFDKDDEYLDCAALPEEDIEKIRKCKDRNVLNVHLSKITNKYDRMVFNFKLTNQYNEQYDERVIFDSSNNTYTSWIDSGIKNLTK